VNSLLESICKLCEKKYKVFRYLVKSGQKFCSFECYWKSLKGRPTWNKGKKCSSISKGKLGKTTANKGRVFSKEWRDKLSRALMDKKVSLEARKKMSLAKKGCNSPMLGKHHSEETKAKLREIRLKQKFTIEQIREYSPSTVEKARRDISRINLSPQLVTALMKTLAVNPEERDLGPLKNEMLALSRAK